MSFSSQRVSSHSLLPGLFARPSLNFILGTPGSKKTWLGLDLAVSVAAGRSWLGFPCAATPALFLDEELGLARLRDRLGSVMLAHRLSPHLPLHYTSFAGYDFAKQDEAASLTAQVRSVGAGLVILDQPFRLPAHVTLAQLLALRPLLANLRLLADSTSSAILVLLHTRQRRTGLAPLLLAMGADHFLAVDSPFGESWLHLRTLASNGLHSLSITADLRIRQSRFGKIWSDPQFVGAAPSQTTPKPPIGRAGFAVLQYLAAHGETSRTQLATKVSAFAPGRILNLIKELSKDGFICRTNPGGKGIPSLYALTKAGRDLIPEFS